MNDLLPFRILLLRSGRIFTDKINQLLESSELNYSLWQVLYAIAHARQTTLIEIAQELAVSQPAITKRIYELQQKNLIENIPSTNRREKIVQLNANGLSIFNTCRQQVEALEKKYLAGISLEEEQYTREILTKFMNNLRDGDLLDE